MDLQLGDAMRWADSVGYTIPLEVSPLRVGQDRKTRLFQHTATTPQHK